MSGLGLSYGLLKGPIESLHMTGKLHQKLSRKDGSLWFTREAQETPRPPRGCGPRS